MDQLSPQDSSHQWRDTWRALLADEPAAGRRRSIRINDLARQLAAARGVTRPAARDTIRTILELITAAAQRGDTVALKGFGRFAVTELKGGDRRNPRTGEPVTVGARKRLRFSAAQTFKDRLNGAARRD